MGQPVQPNDYPHVIAVIGPTATGKTKTGVAIATAFNGEVISADSQQIYEGLPIGTAQPSLEEQGGIPHHLIGFVPPNAVYSTAQYQIDAEEKLQSILQQGKTPVVVGGTGFYIRSFLEESYMAPVSPNPDLRAQLQQRLEEEGESVLYEELKKLDPERALALHPHDHFRVLRALEIILTTGKPVPKHLGNRRKDIHVHWIGLAYENRPLLWERITSRVHTMLEAGWLDEVQHVLDGYGPEAQALQVAHGYPELLDVLLGKRSLESAIEQITINVRQYSRRQITWFKRNPDITWFYCDAPQWTQDRRLESEILETLNTTLSQGFQ